MVQSFGSHWLALRRREPKASIIQAAMLWIDM